MLCLFSCCIAACNRSLRLLPVRRRDRKRGWAQPSLKQGWGGWKKCHSLLANYIDSRKPSTLASFILANIFVHHDDMIIWAVVLAGFDYWGSYNYPPHPRNLRPCMNGNTNWGINECVWMSRARAHTLRFTKRDESQKNHFHFPPKQDRVCDIMTNVCSCLSNYIYNRFMKAYTTFNLHFTLLYTKYILMSRCYTCALKKNICALMPFHWSIKAEDEWMCNDMAHVWVLTHS